MPVDPAMQELLVNLTSDIVSAHVGNNTVAVGDLPVLISNVYNALASIEESEPAEKPVLEPAVPIRSSIKHEYLVCLEDGKKMKMLKRYLAKHYEMTPSQYRARWNLPLDYPMVAPAYSQKRRDLAKLFGLGRRAGDKAAKPVAKRARKPTQAES
jgi:predicted transcriptional regulator